jgi:hypothetical protein
LSKRPVIPARRLPACWDDHDRSNLKGSLSIAMNRM